MVTVHVTVKARGSTATWLDQQPHPPLLARMPCHTPSPNPSITTPAKHVHAPALHTQKTRCDNSSGLNIHSGKHRRQCATGTLPGKNIHRRHGVMNAPPPHADDAQRAAPKPRTAARRRVRDAGQGEGAAPLPLQHLIDGMLLPEIGIMNRWHYGCVAVCAYMPVVWPRDAAHTEASMKAPCHAHQHRGSFLPAVVPALVE